MDKPKYKRVLLKLSGEALAGDRGFGINNDVVNEIAEAIKRVQEIGVEVAVVVGGGNFWRGRTSEGMDRTTADYIGMLATVMNSMALQDALENTAAALRAAEMEAEIILLAKKVDGVYDKDPVLHADAKKFDELSYIEVLQKELKVMDSTATSLCMDNNIPIKVFELTTENILKAVHGENIGTTVH